MWNRPWMVGLAVLLMSVAGCGGGDKPADDDGGEPAAEQDGSTGTTAALSPPAAAVSQFLEAVRSGNDDQTAMMLTPTARQIVSQLQLSVTPEGSDTASFEVGQVDMVDENGARVACTWSDMDQDPEHVLWMVRRDAEGWRIAGLAAPTSPGQPPRALNFEDIEQMTAFRDAQRGTYQAKVPEDGQSTLQ